MPVVPDKFLLKKTKKQQNVCKRQFLFFLQLTRDVWSAKSSINGDLPLEIILHVHLLIANPATFFLFILLLLFDKRRYTHIFHLRIYGEKALTKESDPSNGEFSTKIIFQHFFFFRQKDIFHISTFVVCDGKSAAFYTTLEISQQQKKNVFNFNNYWHL